jgi:hypothetical protein
MSGEWPFRSATPALYCLFAAARIFYGVEVPRSGGKVFPATRTRVRGPHGAAPAPRRRVKSWASSAPPAPAGSGAVPARFVRKIDNLPPFDYIFRSLSN